MDGDALKRIALMPRELTVLIPGPMSDVREALASCALEGNTYAQQILETIRRVEAGDPIGERYVRQLNEFMSKHYLIERVF